MPDLDLAVSVRNYARNHGGDLVSSAWLADHFGVDPRTIAAALRPYGVAPGEVERGVRGYQIADLAGIVLPGDAAVEEWAAEAVKWAEDAVLVNREASALPAGWDLVDARPDHVVRAAAMAGVDPDVVRAEAGFAPDDAISRLSAGAGHDMTPALRAAGLL